MPSQSRLLGFSALLDYIKEEQKQKRSRVLDYRYEVVFKGLLFSENDFLERHRCKYELAHTRTLPRRIVTAVLILYRVYTHIMCQRDADGAAIRFTYSPTLTFDIFAISL